MSSWQVEMLWRCTSCAHRNRGRDLVCGACGGPKDGSETYEMPDDSSRAAAVEDPKLLEVARAGENWRCGYCSSDQRARDGSCARCGGGRIAHPEPPVAQGLFGAAPPRAQPATMKPASPTIGPLTRIVLQTLAAAAAPVVIAAAVLIPYSWWRSRPVPQEVPQQLEAKVVKLRSRTFATLERYVWVTREGFDDTRPADALDVKALGDRLHHHDKVKVGTKLDSYSEKVSDGTTSETYSEREACGQTCSGSPRSCRNVCKSNKNGFATCNEVCTGGGQTCTTKYCSVTKTRQVPKFKMVTKMREIDVFKSVPRYAPFSAWRQMAWVPFRKATLVGDGNVVRPLTAEQLGESVGDASISTDSAELAAAPARVVTTATELAVEVEYSVASTTKTCVIPLADAASFRALAIGTKRRLTVTSAACTFTDPIAPDPAVPELPGNPRLEVEELRPVLAPPDASVDAPAGG